MTYAEKAKELISTTDGLVDIAMGLHSLCSDADEEISEITKEAADEYNKCEDALCKIEDLEAQLAESTEKRVNLLNHIKGQKIWIKSLRKDIENSISKARVKCKICNDDGLYCNFCNTTVTQGKNDE